MKKKLNTDSIANELSSGSLFFTPPAPSLKKKTMPIRGEVVIPSSSSSSQKVTSSKKTKNRTPRSPRTVSNNSKEKRVRRSFELYASQFKRITRASQELSAKKGEYVSKSQVVRTALEKYLKSIGV